MKLYSASKNLPHNQTETRAHQSCCRTLTTHTPCFPLVIMCSASPQADSAGILRRTPMQPPGEHPVFITKSSSRWACVGLRGVAWVCSHARSEKILRYSPRSASKMAE